MDSDDVPRRSLADDPDFRASLADLDRGMRDEGPRKDDVAGERLPDLDSARDADTLPDSSGAHPLPMVPRSPVRVVPAPSAPPFPPVLSAPEPSQQNRRRPLMELFPLPERRTAPSASAVLSLAPPAALRASPDADAVATYETFYGLNERPFSLSTDPKFLYHSRAHDQVAQAMIGAIGRHERLVVMTGAAGLGKTTLCRAVIDQLDRRTVTSLVAARFVSTDELLKTLLADFGVTSRDDVERGMLADASRADLAAALHGFLVSLAALQAFAVVILDDAHDLPIEVLDEIRVLAEDIGDEPAMQIVLVGQPALDNTLSRAALREWDRRVSTRCRLTPIAAGEVGSYIAHRLAVAGTRPRVEFADTAAARVYEVSGGVPRVINLLCDRTLEEGFKASASLLDGELVTAAAEALELSSPSSPSSWARKAALAAMLLVLVLIGATAATFVFRSDLSVLLRKWENMPRSPEPPRTESPEPISAVPPR